MEGVALVLIALAGTVVIAAATVGLLRWLSDREGRDDGDD